MSSLVYFRWLFLSFDKRVKEQPWLCGLLVKTVNSHAVNPSLISIVSCISQNWCQIAPMFQTSTTLHVGMSKPSDRGVHIVQCYKVSLLW